MQNYNGAAATVIHLFTSFSLVFWEIKARGFALDAYIWLAYQTSETVDGFSLHLTAAEIFKYIKHSLISWEKVASG